MVMNFQDKEMLIWITTDSVITNNSLITLFSSPNVILIGFKCYVQAVPIGPSPAKAGELHLTLPLKSKSQVLVQL